MRIGGRDLKRLSALFGNVCWSLAGDEEEEQERIVRVVWRKRERDVMIGWMGGGGVGWGRLVGRKGREKKLNITRDVFDVSITFSSKPF